MAKPTREEVTAALQTLPPEQHEAFLAEVERRLNAPDIQPAEQTQATVQNESAGPLSWLTAGASPYAAAPVSGPARGQPEALAIAASALPAVSGGVVPATKALVGGLVGAAGGNEAGRWVGRNLPIVGGETAADVLGAIGGFVGGGIGGATGPKVEGGRLLKFVTGGKGGLLQEILGGGEAQAAVAAREAAVSETAALRNEYLKTRTDAVRQRMADSMRRTAIATAKEARLAKQAGISVPDLRSGVAEIAAAQPAAAITPPAQILPDGQRAMGTNLGGVAQPGPPPTSPDQLEAALRATLEKNAASPLQAPRIQVGAQNVGRQVGMTKEEVRRVAGPVLDEALGEASPILPKKAFQNIIDTMKDMPMAEREAYVARATSGKTKWQVENVRRTLEHLGLLLPAGMAGMSLADLLRASQER